MSDKRRPFQDLEHALDARGGDVEAWGDHVEECGRAAVDEGRELRQALTALVAAVDEQGESVCSVEVYGTAVHEAARTLSAAPPQEGGSDGE